MDFSDEDFEKAEEHAFSNSLKKYNIEYDVSENFIAFDKYGGGQHVTITTNNGTSSDFLKGTSNAKLIMQIYKCDAKMYGKPDMSTEEYVTTLVKTYYTDRVDFDISPVLTTFSDYGKLTHFRFTIDIMTTSSVKPFENIADISNLYSTIGFKTKNSQPYIPWQNVPTLANNVGTGIDWANVYPLYVWGKSIKFSWFGKNDTDTFHIFYLDSAFNLKYTTSVKHDNKDGIDITVNLNEEYMNKSSYISINLPSDNKGKLLYTIIKGRKATDKCTRLYWRNEMGGISFFDFTGQHQTDMKIDNTTYMKGNFDYYNSNEREQSVVYNKDISHQYSITTHVMDGDSIKQFESLAKSCKVWFVDDEHMTIENVIISDVKTNVFQDYDNLYNVTVSYTLSREN